MKETVIDHKVPKPFLNAVDAAEYLGIALITLYSYSSKRVIPHYKARRKIYFKLEDLENFVLNNDNRVKSNEEIEREAIHYEALHRK
jgi:excisionase family DNA binding protein